jgi:hypothetical protein
MATLAGVRRMSRRVLAPQVAHVPVALEEVSAQAMVGPVAAVALDSVEVPMARATAPTRPRMARHATPRR